MKEYTVDQAQAKRWWVHAQGLDERAPFGSGVSATSVAIEHLGYVQIDTISVIERSHHHILFTRIPDYQKEFLRQSQSQDKTVFEYWTHALSYLPTKDFRYFYKEMKAYEKSPSAWFRSVKKQDYQKVLKLIKKEGPISIRDINDDVLVEKNHPWASRKPSKKALQLGFYTGKLVISERLGMLKKYELAERHFSWKQKPKPASEKEILEYILARALRTQGIVSVDSICYLDAKKKPLIKALLDTQVKAKKLTPLKIRGDLKTQYWIPSSLMDQKPKSDPTLVHILSPFDPLIIQRKRLQALFDYEHRFEAYLPKEKRKFGYFALPVLIDDKIVAAVDLKTDRNQGELLIQKWSWLGKSKSVENKRKIEQELHRFEKFQLEIPREGTDV